MFAVAWKAALCTSWMHDNSGESTAARDILVTAVQTWAKPAPHIVLISAPQVLRVVTPPGFMPADGSLCTPSGDPGLL